MEGAVVALMLYEIGHSMESVPDMNDQMKVMNSLMKAMPVMATEMQRMNANMSVITALADFKILTPPRAREEGAGESGIHF
jgi:hypothetical protein